MHLYTLYGYEERYILQHAKKYSQKEFEKMCKEAPILESYGLRGYNSVAIKKYIVEKYGFKPIKYTAGFFTDADIE